MKIVIMNTVPYGSTGRISYNIGKKAKDKGHEVIIVNGWTKHRREDEDVIVATGFFSKAFHLLMAKITGMDGCFSYISTLKLIRKLNKFQPDIVHMHIMHDYFLHLNLLFSYFKKKRIKIIWTFHDCWAFTGGCPYFSISKCEQWKSGCTACPLSGNKSVDAYQKMWDIKSRFAKNDNIWITTPSVWLAEMVSKSFWHDKTCLVIRNGLDLNVFHYRKSLIRDRIGLVQKYMVLGVAYDWGIRKGLDVFNELADLLPEEYRIVLVGTSGAIDAKINPKILSIHKTESQNELVEFYSAADVFVNPTREEVFGMVNIEAIACGTPVVTFRTDGAPEGVNDDCGIVVENRTAQGLVPFILEVCEKKDFDRDKMQSWINQFDENKCYNDYLDLYNNVCSN